MSVKTADELHEPEPNSVHVWLPASLAPARQENRYSSGRSSSIQPEVPSANLVVVMLPQGG